MTRSYRSVLHRAGNTTSTTQSSSGESRGATRASREDANSDKPSFLLKTSVCALLVAMGGLGYLNTASAAPITVLKDSGTIGAASCVANEGSADATGKLDWSCVVKGQAGSVGLLSMHESGDRLGWSYPTLRNLLTEDSVAIGREVSNEDARGSIAIGAKANVRSSHGIAIGKGAKVVNSVRVADYISNAESYSDIEPPEPVFDGGIAIGEEANAIREGDIVIGKQAGKNSRIDPYIFGLPSVILGAGAGRDARIGGSLLIGRSAGVSSDGGLILPSDILLAKDYWAMRIWL